MTVTEKQALIGQPIPRPAVRRLIRGRGRYVGDINLPRMLHLAFVRSPHAPGIALVASGADIAPHCKPFIADGIAQNLPGHKVPQQHLIAVDVAHYQGQPVVAVAAESRAAAEDAAERVEIAWEPLAPILDG